MSKKEFDMFMTLPGGDFNGVTVKVEVPFMTVCPIPEVYGAKPKPYGGTLTIFYMVKSTLLEWDTFAEWIKLFVNKSAGAEQFLVRVFNTLLDRVDPLAMTVIVTVDIAFHLPVKLALGAIDVYETKLTKGEWTQNIKELMR